MRSRPYLLSCLDCAATEFKNRRGLCDRCYQRRIRHGIPLPPKTGTFEHLMVLARSGRTDDECWPWPGSIHRGYAEFGGKPAYRRAYEDEHGPIPDGLEPDHRCHTDDPDCFESEACPHRACVNPGHIEPVTHAENVRRAHQPLKPTCPAGHEMTLENTYVSPNGSSRQCVTCRAIRAAEDYQRKKNDPAFRARQAANLRAWRMRKAAERLSATSSGQG